MSKEEILRKNYEYHKSVVIPDTNWATFEDCENDGTTSMVYAAMEEYARQKAIEFFKWNCGKINGYIDWLKHDRKNAESEEEYAKMCEITSFELSSFNKLYDLFIQSQNTDKP